MKRFLVLAITAILVLSCSKGDDGNSGTLPPVVTKDVTIDSYGSPFGFAGDLVKINGSNFPKKSECKVFMDDIAVEVVSVDENGKTMTIRLPEISSGKPKIRFEFGNRNITNYASNIKYDNGIGVINKKVGQWAKTAAHSVIKKDSDFIERVYTASKGNMVIAHGASIYDYYTDDYGLNWQFIPYGVTNTPYCNIYLTSDMKIYSQIFRGDDYFVQKYDISSGKKEDYSISYPLPKGNGGIAGIALDDQFQNGTIVTSRGNVYALSEGGKKVEQVASPPEELHLPYRGFSLSDKHIWASGTVSKTREPIIYFCNGNKELWRFFIFRGKPDHIVTSMYFVDSQVGYAFVRYFVTKEITLVKTTDGGRNWSEINKMPNTKVNDSMVFLTANHGFAMLDNKIYETTDGGANWKVDLTLEKQAYRLTYEDNCLVAIGVDDMYRKFLK